MGGLESAIEQDVESIYQLALEHYDLSRGDILIAHCLVLLGIVLQEVIVFSQQPLQSVQVLTPPLFRRHLTHTLYLVEPAPLFPPGHRVQLILYLPTFLYLPLHLCPLLVRDVHPSHLLFYQWLYNGYI